MIALDSKTGIVLRQTLDTNGTFLDSPDLICTADSAAFDPSSFVDPNAYGWYFSRSPKQGVANYVYLRGINYTPTGAQTSRAYLYWARSDQILDPTKWRSSGFSIGGAAQNYINIISTTRYEYVATGAVMWTPPVANDITYYLMAWVDNSASPSVPTFPTTPFASLAELGAYIANHPTLVVTDTIYRGMFLRQAPGQLCTQAGSGAQTSPDIIVCATAALDASAWATQQNYSPGTLSATAVFGVRNFVYVRAINTNGAPQISRVYLFWATTTSTTPAGWQPTDFTVAGVPQNYVDLVSTKANEVVVSTVPLVWTPPPSPSGNYLLAAYVDPTGGNNPPDFTAFSYLAPAAATAVVAGHPQLAWLQVTGANAPVPTAGWEAPISVGSGVTSLYVGVQLTAIPKDGTISISIPGPDAVNTVVVQNMTVPDPNAYVAWPVTYPTGFATSAVMTYRQGATPVGAGAIVSTVVPRPPKAGGA